MHVLGDRRERDAVRDAGIDARKPEAVGAERQQGTILGPRALLDEIADDVRHPPVGQVDGVAGGPVGLVHDAVVEKNVAERPALDVVADPRVVRVARPEREAPGADDVDVVRPSVAGAVGGEFRALDHDVALRASARQEAGVVIVEAAVAHRETDTLAADSGAAALRRPRAREFGALDGYVPALDDPDALALGEGAAGAPARHAADGADREIALEPDGRVAVVDARVDLDDVAVAGRARGAAREAKRPSGPDPQDAQAEGCFRSTIS